MTAKDMSSQVPKDVDPKWYMCGSGLNRAAAIGK